MPRYIALVSSVSISQSVSHNTIARTRSRIPGCEGVFVVPGAGHTSNLENRDSFNQVLREFVVKHS